MDQRSVYQCQNIANKMKENKANMVSINRTSQTVNQPFTISIEFYLFISCVNICHKHLLSRAEHISNIKLSTQDSFHSFDHAIDMNIKWAPGKRVRKYRSLFFSYKFFFDAVQSFVLSRSWQLHLVNEWAKKLWWNVGNKGTATS